MKGVSSSPSTPRGVPNEGYFDESGDVDQSKEVAKEIMMQVRENLMGHHHRNETQCSSVLSNGYNGDDSSFNKSDNEDPVGNLSDSDEIMSPASRHSWTVLIGLKVLSLLPLSAEPRFLLSHLSAERLRSDSLKMGVDVSNQKRRHSAA
ncbi:Uncharacterized protein Rs2_49349 [Raphanus sativus]|nr:Uncharacterized protein Rs2_49349 [Raphanus sativus]